MEKLAGLFSWLPTYLKRFLLYAYFAGMAFFIVAWIFGAGFVEVGIVMGLFSVIIVEPILEVVDMGNRARDIKTIFRARFAVSIIVAVFICYIAAIFRHTISENIREINFEPITFGLFYSSIYTGLSALWGLVRRKPKEDL